MRTQSRFALISLALFLGTNTFAQIAFQPRPTLPFLDSDAYLNGVSWIDVDNDNDLDVYGGATIAAPEQQGATQSIEICLPFGDTIHLNPSSPIGGTWSSNCGNCVDASGIFNTTGLAAGNYQVLYHSNGSTDTFLIALFPQPQITLTGPDSASISEKIPLSASGAQNYLWMPSGSLSCGNCSNTEFTADSTTVFTVVGTDLNGCRDTATLTVHVRTEIKFDMPNAFTPNGDQANDFFRPVFKGNIFLDYRLAVYDRWGERVFDSYLPTEGWDGRLFGSLPLISDVYVYVLEYELINGEKGAKKGEVTLLR